MVKAHIQELEAKVAALEEKLQAKPKKKKEQ